MLIDIAQESSNKQRKLNFEWFVQSFYNGLPDIRSNNTECGALFSYGEVFAGQEAKLLCAETVVKILMSASSQKY